MNRTPAAIWLVARRELQTRVRTRAFVLGTLGLIAAVALYPVIMLVVGSSSSDTVGLAGQAAGIARPLEQATATSGSPVQTREVPSRQAGQQQVRDGDLDALVIGAPDALTLVVKQGNNGALRHALDTVVRQQALDTELAKSGLNPAQVETTLRGAHAHVSTLEPTDPQRGIRVAVAMGAGMLLYMFLMISGQAVAQGVVEEKSSRVVELLLSTIRPAQLLAGKVLGIGLTVLLQFAIIAGLGMTVAMSTGVLALPSGALVSMLGWTVAWFLLGFFLFATVLAAAASLVSRQEDLQSVVTPVIMVLVVPFVFAVTTLPSNPESSLGTVLSLIPGFSPLLMPMRIAMGVAAPWQVALAVALALVAIVALVRLGGRIYSNAVLRTGARVRLADALRLR